MFNRFAAFRTSFLQDIARVQSTTRTISPQTTSNAFLNTFASLVQAKSNVASTIVKPVDEQTTRITASKAAKVNLDVDHLLQWKNECGSTSLAMILKYFGKDVSNYHNWFSSDAIGRSPGELTAFARRQDMTVRQKENSTVEELAKLVDQGMPSLVLGINGGGKTTSVEDYVNNFIDNAQHAHWMVFTGYKRNEYGKITEVYLNDPNSLKDKRMSVNDFYKFWNNNLVPDGHRYFMTMAPNGSYQASSLKKMLPTDKLDKWYNMANDTYKNVYSLIKAGKSVEKAVKTAFNKLEDVYDEIADVLDDASDALSDAWNTISGWLS